MKTLFDLLDDGSTGFVLTADLEKWWDAESDGASAAGSSFASQMSILPSDVLDTLKRIAPPDGRLSFEVFIAGVKMWLAQKRRQGVPVPSAPVNPHNGVANNHHQDRNIAERRRPLETLNTGGTALQSLNIRPIRAFGLKDDEFVKSNEPTWQPSMQKNNSLLDVNETSVGINSKQGNHQTVNRRHTLTSGVDYNFIPMMKMMQQEKEVLQSGLGALDNARQWYLRQLLTLEEKQKNFEKSSMPSDYSLETNKERIQHERLRISAINKELNALISGSEKSCPEPLNLAKTQRHNVPAHISKELEALKLQNLKLNQELVQKTRKIEHLEREKVILVKDIFQARSSIKNSEMTLI